MKNSKLSIRNVIISLVVTFSINAHSQVFEDQRERLSDIVNTEFIETKPIISYDNKILFLTRQNHPLNTGGRSDIQDIFYSLRDADGNWQTPTNIGQPLNNEFPNGISSISIGTDSVLVINVFNETGYDKGASLSVKGEDGWSIPEAINIDKFKNKSDYVDYFISSTGNHMFLAIESKNTFGDQDIYVSKKIDAYNWTEPINLGSNINTPEGEFSPFLTSDGKYLFFASYGHEGFGECDIFYSERLDDSWTNWSEAVNLGNKINTTGFEAYFTIPAKGLFAYFVSDFESNGGSRDIFKAKIPLKLNPTPGVILSGVTKNQSSKAPTSSLVTIDPLEDGYPSITMKTNKGNNFTYQRSILEFPKTFQIRADKEMFMSAAQYITVEHEDKRELILDLYMVPIEIDNTLISHDVSFTPSTGILDARGTVEVNRISDYMITYPSIKMIIGSHVAKTENDQVDTMLSEERLQTVYKLFLAKGIDPNRLISVAYGSSEPFSNQNNIKVFDKNRKDERFTFTIYSDLDNDGVIDSEDKCISDPGEKENYGCPALEENVVKVFEQALSGIQFETSKDIIKPISFPILDNVIDIMNENPIFFLIIKGHTDSQGDEDDNQVLSEKRALSTMKYLTENGVSADRLSAYGYGESEPIATNETSEGRAKNRRVVFEVVYDKSDLNR
jgi:OmpA-OmpF porin, OOP family